MKPRGFWQIAVATAGLAALLAYVMACRPAWSPDGSKVLFTYVDDASKVTGVAVHDRKAGTTETLFEASGTKDAVLPWAQWSPDGKRVIINYPVGGDDEDLQVLVLPLGGGPPVRLFNVPKANVLLGAPLAQAEGSLLLAADGHLVRLDLATGRVVRRELTAKSSMLVFAEKDRVFYAQGEFEKPAGQSARDVELGTVDPKDLTTSAVLTLKEAEVGQVSPLFGLSDQGAVATLAVKDGEYHLLVISTADKSVQPVAVKLPAGMRDLGNVQWSADGKTVFTSAIKREKKDSKETAEIVILEITVATGDVRATPVCPTSQSGGAEDFSLFAQVALSPDGKTLALAPLVEAVGPRGAGGRGPTNLYLVDVSSSQREVTTVAPPSAAKANP